jgi:hypothetical protein
MWGFDWDFAGQLTTLENIQKKRNKTKKNLKINTQFTADIGPSPVRTVWGIKRVGGYGTNVFEYPADPSASWQGACRNIIFPFAVICFI